MGVTIYHHNGRKSSGRGRGQGVQIIPDYAEPVQSVIDGKHYTSRRAYSEHLKQHGCEIVGNDYTGSKRPPWMEKRGRETR